MFLWEICRNIKLSRLYETYTEYGMRNLKKTFNRFSLDQKVLTLIVIEVFGFFLLAIVAISQLRNVGDQIEQIEQVTFPLHITIESIKLRIFKQRINASEILASVNRNSVNEDAGIVQSGIYFRKNACGL